MPRQKLNQQLTAKYTTRLQTDIIHQVQIGPTKERSYTDKVCLAIFGLFVIVFVVFLIYFLVNGGAYIHNLTENPSVIASNKGFGPTFVKCIGTIVGMIALSVILSIIFIVLCAKFPKPVVYFGIGLTFLCYLAVIVMAFAMKQFVLAFVLLLVAAVNAAVLYCFRQQIKIGIALLKASGAFMMQKPSIGLIGGVSLLLNIIFLAFYILGWISAYSRTLPENNDSEDSRDQYESMMMFFIFMGIYLGYFLYYLMVFVLSTAVAYWYYQQPQHVLRGYRNVRKHVGSLALASLIITIVTILRRAAQRQANESQNMAMKLVWCLLACIMRCIEGFVEILNHNSIIVMSVTGENYLNSAKTALGLIADNFPLFWIVDFIGDMVQLYSLVVCVLVPAVIGGGIVWGRYEIEDTAVISGVIIFLLSWIVTSIILGILYEALSSVFIMYCFDRKLRLRGFTNGKLPEQIKHLFSDVQTQQNFAIVHQHHHTDSKPSQVNLHKDIKGPSLDSDIQLSSKDSARRRKRKLNRKHAQSKKIDDKSEDNNNKSDAEGDISVDGTDGFGGDHQGKEHKHGVSNYSMHNGNDLDDIIKEKSTRKVEIANDNNKDTGKLHPFYVQQSQLK